MIRKAFLALGLALISGSAAWAIPQTLNFQGLLKESGASVTGTRDITFKIYDVSTGGTALFTEAHSGGNAVTVSTGIFNAIIGDLTSGGIPLNIFSGDDRYIGTTVGGGSELLPRQKVTSVGNAFFAATAASLVPTATIQISSISASSATLTAIGSTQYSLKTSSGILVSSGGVTAPFFSGSFVGDGSGLTGLAGTDSTKVAKTGDSMTGQLTLAGSTLTVTGNAFSVGGATLTVMGGKIGVGTGNPIANLDVNGSAQFGSGATKSTFTSTGLLKLTASGIQWADGSTSTTAVSGAGGGSEVTIASATVILEDRPTILSAMGTCVSGSTVAITCSGVGAIEIFFYGTIDNADGTAGYGAAMNILLNGQYLRGFSSTRWMGKSINDNYNALPVQVGISHREETSCTPSTEYSACVTLARTGGGGTAYLRGSQTPFRIQIMERP